MSKIIDMFINPFTYNTTMVNTKQLTQRQKDKLQSIKELYAVGVYTCSQYEHRRDVILRRKDI
jgi:hypothetical protein